MISVLTVKCAAHRVDQQSASHGGIAYFGMNPARRFKAGLGPSIGDQFDCMKQTAASDVANIRVESQRRLQPLTQSFALQPDIGQKIAVHDRALDRESCRTGHGMAHESVAVHERAGPLCKGIKGAANVWDGASPDLKHSEMDLVVDTGWYADTGDSASLGRRIAAHLELVDRLAPALAARKGVWISALSFAALSAYPEQPLHSAQMAAAHALAISLRARLQEQGASLVAAYPAKLGIKPHYSIAGGTLSWSSLASALVAALQNGHEDVYPDPQSRLWLERLTRDRKALEREMARPAAR